MFYYILADAVMLIHFAFIVYAVFGGVFGLWKKWALWCHLPFALWATLIEFYGWICPLTPLENYLRLQSGAQSYEVGFIERYLSPIIYPPGLTPEIQIGLGVVVLIVNLTIYTFVLTRWKNRSK